MTLNNINDIKIVLLFGVIVLIVAMILKKRNLKVLEIAIKALGFEFKTKATYKTRNK